MVAAPEHPQRIGRLTPLVDGYACIDRLVRPVPPRRVDTAAALGRILAGDVLVANPHPPVSIALRDGWAMRSEETLDAGGYAPALLAQAPEPVEAGAPMPAGADAVADGDAVRQRGTGWEALAGVTAGDGVLPAGADAEPGTPVARAGQRLRRTDVAALAALGVTALYVHEPGIRLASARDDPGLTTMVARLADLVHGEGTAVDVVAADAGPEAAFTPGADLSVLVGGTGSGARDHSVEALAQLGRVEFHGVALAPGETAAFGVVGETPVLLVPGRLDAALAVWLTLGRRIVARLCARPEAEPACSGVLSRKVASSLGLAELVLLRRDGERVAPLAAGYLSLSALTHAAGYLLVPSESEGYPAGTRIEMRALP